MSRIFLIVPAIGMSLFLQSPVAAQSTGRLSGTIEDAAGKVYPCTCDALAAGMGGYLLFHHHLQRGYVSFLRSGLSVYDLTVQRLDRLEGRSPTISRGSAFAWSCAAQLGGRVRRMPRAKGRYARTALCWRWWI
jgi:hypothetical protein